MGVFEALMCAKSVSQESQISTITYEFFRDEVEAAYGLAHHVDRRSQKVPVAGHGAPQQPFAGLSYGHSSPFVG